MRNAQLQNQALNLSAQASQAEAAGNMQLAIRLHSECLTIKVELFGRRSVQAALSFNELGDWYLKNGNLDAAQQALTKALKVRDDKAFGGLELGPR